MTEETTSEQLAEIEGQGDTIQVREGRWRTRGGQEFRVSPMPTDHWDFAPEYPWWDGNVTTWRTDGRFSVHQNAMDLVDYLGPSESDKTQELATKTQELDGKTQELPGYTPPEGWRVVQFGEPLRGGDEYDSGLNRYVRRIESQPQPEPETTTDQVAEIEGQAESTPATEYTPPDGWRVVRFGEELLPGDVWVNQDGTEQRSNILHWDAASVSGGRCIRRIKPEAQPESDTELQAQVAFLKGREVTLGTRLQQEREVTTRLRGELESVQNRLGESRQRVTQLEELVGSLRTINETQEKAFTAAGKENTALKNQLAAVKAELASVAADRQQLRVELDAAQQVPADSPELRQLRADLEQVTLCADTYRDGYNRVLSDLETARETAKAEAIEAIAEWLQPIRAVDNEHLANETLQHLPQIMRHLTGLDSHAID